MTLDITWFGTGVGIVLAGWVLGMAVGSFFSAVKSVR